MKNGQENSYDTNSGIDQESSRTTPRLEIHLSKYRNVVDDSVDFYSVDLKWVL